MSGNLLIGQSGGPTAVINGSLVGAIDAALRHPEIDGIYGALHGVEGLLQNRIVDLRRESRATLDLVYRTPSAALGSCRFQLQAQDIDRLVSILQRLDVRYFLYIGGNDSADTSHRIAIRASDLGYPLQVIGIPKTVDNDLMHTDHCPGYGSIARFVASVTRDAGRDTEALPTVHPVKIIQVMGRNSGWVAGASALAKKSDLDAPQLIYFPELVFDRQKFLSDVRTVCDRIGYAIVVVCERVKDETGEVVGGGEALFIDAFGHPYHEGPAGYLCRLVDQQLGLRARYDKPGTAQRMAMSHVSETDLEEAYLLGKMAVDYAVAGESDKMVILLREPGEIYRCSTGLADLETIANSERTLPADYINAAGNFVTEAFLNYARPLIGGPLPDYGRLSKIPF
ncbi:MAG: 6-phosphofructokinase [Dehalococcoidia bacterium]|nr:6-phosphofructokinase [Dehalococcoidia bacterium]